MLHKQYVRYSGDYPGENVYLAGISWQSTCLWLLEICFRPFAPDYHPWHQGGSPAPPLVPYGGVARPHHHMAPGPYGLPPSHTAILPYGTKDMWLATLQSGTVARGKLPVPRCHMALWRDG